jgi:transposase
MDGRHLAPKTLEQIRKLGMDRILKGVSPELVIQVFGFSRRTVYRWIERFKSGGDAGLDWNPAPGRTPLLSESNRSWLLQTILHKNPTDFGFKSMLWTQAIVKSLLHKELKIDLHRSTVGRILNSLSLTPQVPLRRALERNPKAIKKWKEQEYPTLREKVRKERASLYFLDEMGIRATAFKGTTYGLEGERPIVESTGKNVGVNFISAISISKHLHFMAMEKNFNSEVFLTFLEHLMASTPRKLYVVTDHHSAHQSKVVQAFLKTHEAKIEVVFLPTYSPELNPDEWVWQSTKGEVKKEPKKDKADLKTRTLRALNTLKRSSQKISGIFRAPDLAYLFTPS